MGSSGARGNDEDRSGSGDPSALEDAQGGSDPQEGPAKRGSTEPSPAPTSPPSAQLSHKPCLRLSEDVASAEGGGEIVERGLFDVAEENEGPVRERLIGGGWGDP